MKNKKIKRLESDILRYLSDIIANETNDELFEVKAGHGQWIENNTNFRPDDFHANYTLFYSLIFQVFVLLFYFFDHLNNIL